VSLHVQLDYELPAEVAAGAGTAVFVSGWCFSAEAPIRTLSFVVNGEDQPVAAQRMPRLDPFRALHPGLDPFATDGLHTDAGSDADPCLLSYRSGFCGLARLGPDDGWNIELRAELDDGQVQSARLGRIAPAEVPQPVTALPAGSHEEPLVAIAMATFNPPADLLQRQLDSIRAQTHRNWICVISDDCSGAEGWRTILELVGEDARFVLNRSPRRLGFYRNFERALSLVPREAKFVAMADQDDRWDEDKLASLVGALGKAQLVYSDARVVSRDGELISDTWWSQRRNNHVDLLSLLVANAVTGAASLLRRELLDHALPFPPAQFAHYHDHWIALTALALGEIEFVPRPLYDYVQHGEASLGHEAANRMTPLRERLRHRRELRERVRMWRLHYFADVWRLVQFATVLRIRCGERMSARKRRTLERFIAGERSLPLLASLAARGARELHGTPETLGAEWMLLHALVWRRLLDASASERPQRRLRLDAVPPPTLVQSPGRGGSHAAVTPIAEKIEPLRWMPSEAAPQRINLLIPTVDLAHLFGGYIGKFNLASRLASRGVRVRIVTVDPSPALPPDWRGRVESYAGLGGLFDSVEIAFGRESAGIEMSRSDAFIATTWWTAHIASAALSFVEANRFLYLIQEYEPFTFPMGTLAALAAESYRFPHFALFSSELLRGYFRAHRIGVFAGSVQDGDRDSVAFENAITAVEPPTAEELAARNTRRLLFYARPEPHAARNMFELGMMALERALRDGVFRSGWELNGIGTVQRGGRLALGGGAHLNLTARADQASYARLLREHDVGLALMYTPHPSLVPLEMASAGLVTVTNSFENKTPEAMSAISENLIVAEPSVEGVARALAQAAAAVADADGRARGSQVRWSRSWSESFPDPLLDLLLSKLRASDAEPLLQLGIEAGNPRGG
jgi:glycosyltransferase involved in cell wall biosynthesis